MKSCDIFSNYMNHAKVIIFFYSINYSRVVNKSYTAQFIDSILVAQFQVTRAYRVLLIYPFLDFLFEFIREYKLVVLLIN